MINYKLYLIDFIVHLVILFLIAFKNFNVYTYAFIIDTFFYYNNIVA